MKHYRVYAGRRYEESLVDEITVSDDYTAKDYRECCRKNADTAPCDWQCERIYFEEVMESGIVLLLPLKGKFVSDRRKRKS